MAMVRVLKFKNDEKDRDRFIMLYQGFLAGGNSPGAKPLDVRRTEGKVLDKFEAAGKIEGDAVSFNKEEAELTLEQPEYELLKKYFEATPWVTAFSRKVLSISDWMASITPEDR